MNDSEEGTVLHSSRTASGPQSENKQRLRGFLAATATLALCFGKPLYELVQLAISSDLLSYVPLVPVVSIYLTWQKRRTLPPRRGPDYLFTAAFAVTGLVALSAFWLPVLGGTKYATEDALALNILAFLFFFAGLTCFVWGRSIVGALAFPLGFLIFMVPLPLAWTDQVESFLQHGSGAVAFVLFKLRGTPVLRQDLVFMLPGITLEIAPQCSGIHSSLVLFLTSLVAGHLFLRSQWKRATLALAVIPLALLRNGLRVFTIGELCVRVSPDMIDSYIHHHGGPIFFAASLVPLFALLLLLYRSDRKSAPKRTAA